MLNSEYKIPLCQVPAPTAKLNNQTLPHQIVVVLPLRQDGKIWTGTATFTASKPIEIEVIHRYNPTVLPDAKHGNRIMQNGLTVQHQLLFLL